MLCCFLSPSLEFRPITEDYRQRKFGNWRLHICIPVSLDVHEYGCFIFHKHEVLWFRFVLTMSSDRLELMSLYDVWYLSSNDKCLNSWSNLFQINFAPFTASWTLLSEQMYGRALWQNKIRLKSFGGFNTENIIVQRN